VQQKNKRRSSQRNVAEKNEEGWLRLSAATQRNKKK
jgi:hypothetical protein